jgi:hypothetical protein
MRSAPHHDKGKSVQHGDFCASKPAAASSGEVLAHYNSFLWKYSFHRKLASTKFDTVSEASL